MLKLLKKIFKTATPEHNHQAKSSQYEAPKIDSPYGDFDIQPWCGDDIVNGIDFSKKARSYGRYEVAEAFHRTGTKYYGENIVNATDPIFTESLTEEDFERFKSYHQQYLEYIPEFSLLASTRERFIAALAAYPEGIQRNKLKPEVEHAGVTKWGVICNQLAKGGFIRQEGEVLYPEPARPVSNEEFLAKHIPAPGTSGL